MASIKITTSVIAMIGVIVQQTHRPGTQARLALATAFKLEFYQLCWCNVADALFVPSEKMWALILWWNN